MELSNKNKTSGRWKEPALQYRPEIDIQTITKKLLLTRRGKPFFAHLTVAREVRICVRYLIDEDCRLTRVAQEIRARPARVREMFLEYGVDIRNRKLIFDK